MGYDIISLNTKHINYTIPYSAVAECDGAKIEVLDDGKIILYLTPEKGDFSKEIEKLKDYADFTIIFEGYGSENIDGTNYQYGLPLPDGYRFVYYNMTYKEALKTTKYLFSKYGAFSGIKSPGYNLFAHYTYAGDFGRLYTTVFKNKGSLKQRILNYHFNNLSFSATDLGGLSGISRKKFDLSQKIGDYPIITAAKARKLLLKRHYITSVPEELPGEEYIARVTLVYRTSRWDKVIMPYYKFFVEIPSGQMENGLKTFGTFYVPAVKSEYLENIPLWDGSIN